ncbi:hypothetical protein CLU79DRAFT_887206 [Phycomyces nitens]|nr:hypothetical protein CLU79DRAFT_887206 [Phycomyces nitens]
MAALPIQTDFRTAIIENHWNDPPRKIFQKTLDDQQNDLDFEQITSILTFVLEDCQTQFATGPNKRITQDTTRRIQEMLAELEKGNVSETLSSSLSGYSQALQSKDFKKATDIHTQLIMIEYERHGPWIVGMKRLADLYEKSCA